jgi:hypothetical protein
MALFDCELNNQHIQLCKALSVTYYPTLLFVGSGPYHATDPVTGAILGAKSAGVMGPAPVWNTVKFQGNWQMEMPLRIGFQPCKPCRTGIRGPPKDLARNCGISFCPPQRERKQCFRLEFQVVEANVLWLMLLRHRPLL